MPGSLHVVHDAGVASRLSVVIPTYCRPAALRSLLGSLARQSCRGGFEVVVSDDGAPDEVLEVARLVGQEFARLVVVTGPNGGPGVARNRGAAAARADVLAFVDDDCEASESWLRALLSEIDRGADMVQGPVVSSVPPIEPFVHAFRIDRPGAPGGVFAIRRHVFHALGGFDAALSRAGEDHEFFERATRAGIALAFSNAAVVLHPPRLKRLRVPLFDPGPAQALYAAQRHFALRVPKLQRTWVSWNRRLLFRALVKTLLVAAVIFLAFLSPLLALFGGLILVGKPIARWRHANRMLRDAGEPLRVPFSQCLRYVALFPWYDQLELLERLRFGCFSVRS